MMHKSTGIIILSLVVLASAGDMLRKSIVFDPYTPDVFYCPIEKPTSLETMIVKARPLSKLCEHHGKQLPADYKSDCYNDVDETEFACHEKERIMMRINQLDTSDGSRSINEL